MFLHGSCWGFQQEWHTFSVEDCSGAMFGIHCREARRSQESPAEVVGNSRREVALVQASVGPLQTLSGFCMCFEIRDNCIPLGLGLRSVREEQGCPCGFWSERLEEGCCCEFEGGALG